MAVEESKEIFTWLQGGLLFLRDSILITAITEQVLDEIVEAIVREVDPERIILFGSHGRDRAKADSDIDL